MKYAVIIVKDKYEELGDFVFRPLIRAYEKIGVGNLLDEDNAFLLGYIDNGLFIEFFTNKEIQTDYYIEISENDLKGFLNGLSYYKMMRLYNSINSIVFQDDTKEKIVKDDIKHNTFLDACDRGVEFDAFTKGLSIINPYDMENPNLYKDFINKINLCNDAKLSYQKRK